MPLIFELVVPFRLSMIEYAFCLYDREVVATHVVFRCSSLWQVVPHFSQVKLAFLAVLEISGWDLEALESEFNEETAPVDKTDATMVPSMASR